MGLGWLTVGCTTNCLICFDVLRPLPTLLTYLCCSDRALYAEYHANPKVVLNLGAQHFGRSNDSHSNRVV